MYIAFDLDALDESEGVSVAMPEPKGLSRLDRDDRDQAARGDEPHRRLRADGDDAPHGLDMSRHTDIVAQLTEAALGRA